MYGNNSYYSNIAFLTAEEYLSLTYEERLNIESITIVPPKLGENDFGKFKVKYKCPLSLYGNYKKS